MSNKYIIISGNPVDGFTFIGPFDSADEATQYTESNSKDLYDWWLAPLTEPTEETPNLSTDSQ
ncbi:hypothetical protein [Rhizobium phage RHph_X2_28B]|uniref:hypothetical protein n=1 Tax=Rhizobium phage RHph_X2_28B TaxID=2836086 RepID=UPI0023296698|nr:hypothetical protein PP751_gp094 [Rhizobium phage RHph_X2_28B]QWY83553.1 hypothetical protein [Rhizobium phage RHph_X2_28B]